MWATGWLLGALLLLRVALVPAWATADGKIGRDGFDLYYRTVGKGEPLVLLSGGPGVDVGLLQPVADELGKDYECVLLEQRGTGRSRMKSYTPANCNLKLYIDDLEALRGRLKADRITLLGNSWGMILALAYGEAHPDRVRAIITMGSGPVSWQYFSCFSDNLRMRLRPAEEAALERAHHMNDPEQAAWETLKALMPGYFYDYARGVRYAQNERPDGFNGALSGLVLGAMRRRHFDLRPGMRKITAPVLLLQGRQDPAGEANLYEAHLALSGSRMVFLERCGHLPWLEKPDSFFRECRRFLGEVYGGGSTAAGTR